MTTKPFSAATLILGLLASGPVFADDDECSIPLSDWQPKSAVAAMAKAKGWEIRRIKTDDGCYEIKARDSEGREVEATIDPSSLRILRTEREDGEDGDEGRNAERRDDDDDDDEGSLAPVQGSQTYQAPSATIPPPAQGLFNGGARPKAQVN